ncbi:hypothetical protein [Streptomyces sp. NPDC056192]|uniref:hypothetical protein n=1 Tax=unclassified Streptomyces TaxID=2593676 RepID=UPI0035DD531A
MKIYHGPTGDPPDIMWRTPQEKADKRFQAATKKAVQVTGSLFGFERSLSEHPAEPHG